MSFSNLKGNIGLAIVLILVVHRVHSQNVEYVEVRDFESWTSAELKYKPIKKLTFGLQEQLRLDKNSSELKGYFTQLTTRYKVFKALELGLGLRYATKNDNEGKVQGDRNYFRYNFDALYRHSINNFSIRYRLRYQNRNELGVSESEGDVAVEYVRFQARISYNIKGWKLDPILSGETFNYFEDGKSQGLVGFRVTLGTNYKVHKNGKLGVFYRVEQELLEEYPKTTNVLRLKYTYTIKNKKI